MKLSTLLSLSLLQAGAAFAQAPDCRTATNPVIEIKEACVVPSNATQPKLSDRVSAIFWIKTPNNNASCTMNALGLPMQPYDFMKAYSRATGSLVQTGYSMIPAQSGSSYLIQQSPIQFVCVPNIVRDQAYPQGNFRATVQTLLTNGNVNWTGNLDANPESYNSNPNSGDLGFHSNSKLCTLAKVAGTGMSYSEYAQAYYGQTLEQLCPANGVTTPLPVKLIDFTGVALDGSAQLSWKTADESNFASFSVERSEDAVQFTSVGTVAAKGSNSSYSFTDRPSANKVFYRLTMNDRDGSKTFSKVVVIALQMTGTSMMAYPNPLVAGQSISLTLQSNQNEPARMAIIAANGQVVATRSLNLQAGVQTLSISETASLAAGTYFIQVTTQQGAQTSRLIIR